MRRPNLALCLAYLFISSLAAGPFKEARMNPDSADIYERLGFKRSDGVPTFKEIKDAYRRAMSRFHPDKNKDERATEWSKAINEAKDQLESQVLGGRGFKDFGDIFRDREGFDSTFEEIYRESVAAEDKSAAPTPDDFGEFTFGFGNPPLFPNYVVILSRQSARYEHIRTEIRVLHHAGRIEMENPLAEGFTRMRATMMSSAPYGSYQTIYQIALVYDFYHRYSQRHIQFRAFENDGTHSLLSGKLVSVGENGPYMDPYIVLEIGEGANKYQRQIAYRHFHFSDMLLRFGYLSRLGINLRGEELSKKLASCQMPLLK
jgi:curved DNA-binding protein CbpA